MRGRIRLPERSISSVKASPPASRTSAAAALKPSGERAMSTTAPRSRATTLAIARPIPPDAPMTTTAGLNSPCEIMTLSLKPPVTSTGLP